MRPSRLPNVVIVAAAVAPALAASLLAVSVPVHAQPVPVLRDTGGKITVVVMPFEFAAPLPAQPRVAPPSHRPWPPVLVQPVGGIGRAPFFAPQLAHALALPPAPTSTGGPFPGEASNKSPGDAIGIGVADLIVERLLEVPGFRVVERRRLERLGTGDTSAANVLRPRYIITGSVTCFGTEDRRGLGGLGGGFGLGALGFKRPKTQVTLTARIIDAATGEVIASATGAGTSKKGGSVVVGGIGGGVGGGVAIGSGEFRESALGEATVRAVEALVAGIVAKRSRMG